MARSVWRALRSHTWCAAVKLSTRVSCNHLERIASPKAWRWPPGSIHDQPLVRAEGLTPFREEGPTVG
jgi:hypothetical protein